MQDIRNRIISIETKYFGNQFRVLKIVFWRIGKITIPQGGANNGQTMRRPLPSMSRNVPHWSWNSSGRNLRESKHRFQKNTICLPTTNKFNTKIIHFKTICFSVESRVGGTLFAWERRGPNEPSRPCTTPTGPRRCHTIKCSGCAQDWGKWPKGPQNDTKRRPFFGLKISKTLCIPYVFAQNGPPKGNQKGCQNEPMNEQNLARILSQKAPKSSESDLPGSQCLHWN